MILTEVLSTFLKVLKEIPNNLTNASLSLLAVFTFFELRLAVFKIDEIDWQKWLLQKVIRVGILMWIIKNYSWLLNEILKGFLKIGNLALKTGEDTSNYITNPSLIIDYAVKESNKLLEFVGVNPKTWIYFIIIIFIIISMFFIAFQVVITMTEFYFLTGISIIFIPFGAIKMGESYYTNVLKTIAGCSIKVCTLNILLLISEFIILNIRVPEKITLNSTLTMVGTLAVLAYLIVSVPSMATSLLTGSPSLSANEALRSGMAGVAATASTAGMLMKVGKNVGSVASGTANAAIGGIKGSVTGVSKGSNLGAALGSSVGQTGRAAGKVAGAVIGGVGGAVAGGVKAAKQGGEISKLGGAAAGRVSKLTSKILESGNNSSL